MQPQRVFIAGVTGAIGRRLVPQLLAAGHVVHGISRSRERAAELTRAGAQITQADVYDRDSLMRAVSQAQPDTVMHQLTDLPQTLEAGLSEAMLASNARVRAEGGRNLMDAALAAGATCFIAQSLAWVYAPAPPGHRPRTEEDPLDTQTAQLAVTMAGVAALEHLTLHGAPLRGIVLRYGMLYGPGTWSAEGSGNVPVHVDAAAHAALLALQVQTAGIFNIAEERGLVSAAKARQVLGWRAEYRWQDQLRR